MKAWKMELRKRALLLTLTYVLLIKSKVVCGCTCEVQAVACPVGCPQQCNLQDLTCTCKTGCSRGGCDTGYTQIDKSFCFVELVSDETCQRTVQSFLSCGLCLPGFWGANCDACACAAGFTCDEGLTGTGACIAAPTPAPTLLPTAPPTPVPTPQPTPMPTPLPTLAPTLAPTASPTVPPTLPVTVAPTVDPAISGGGGGQTTPAPVPTSSPSASIAPGAEGDVAGTSTLTANNPSDGGLSSGVVTAIWVSAVVLSVLIGGAIGGAWYKKKRARTSSGLVDIFSAP